MSLFVPVPLFCTFAAPLLSRHFLPLFPFCTFARLVTTNTKISEKRNYVVERKISYNLCIESSENTSVQVIWRSCFAQPHNWFFLPLSPKTWRKCGTLKSKCRKSWPLNLKKGRKSEQVGKVLQQYNLGIFEYTLHYNTQQRGVLMLNKSNPILIEVVWQSNWLFWVGR